MEKSYGYYKSPIGWIEVSAKEKLLSLKFTEEVTKEQLVASDNIVVQQALEQIKQYFEKQLSEFNLPLKVKGTPFQESVWQEILKIPYGATATYQDLANRIGNPKAIRAVGTAVGKNQISIIIPCHRIVRTNNNKIINYFWGKERKIFLQNLEQKKN